MNAPDLLQQDQGNRERALEPRSFIVEAPAGAGKTELLTQRFLRLLALVREPEEIVAITFTNKAAAEMRSRILDSLQRAAAGEQPAQPHKRTTWALAQEVLRRSAELDWALLEQPARLRILTIDALCSHLARQMPLLSRFGAQPGVCEDAAEYYREAARRTLAMLEDEAGDGVVTEALGYLDNDTVRLAGLLADMLARRDQWLSHAGRGTLQQEVEQALGRLVRQDLQQATAQFTPALQRQLMPAARYAAANLAGDAALAPLADWSEPLPADPATLPQWRSLCELLLTQKDEWRKSVNVKQGFPAVDEAKPYKQLMQEVIAALPDARAFGRIRALPEVCHAEAEWRMVNCLARLLQLAAAQLWTVFQEAGVVDFVEVSRRALAALEDQSGPTDLALRLDYRIQHLLVDEFQDTSPAQVRLLEKLTAGWQPDDGRTLFCVGDPMQSIYRFRKAEVGLFLQVAELGIGHLRLERLHLTRNNRSCPAVVEWVNQAFARVFPQHDDASRGAIRYRPFVATRAARDGEGVQVHALLRNDEDGSAGAAAYEARYVAALIAEERRRDPGCSMAVLVRARSHLEALVAEIRRHHPDLSFQAVEIEALGGRQSVQDALTLARAMLHRADRVHWLALLRAPWCGLTLADLYALAGDDHHATLWQLMQDEARLARLSPDGRQRLLHVRDVLAASFAQRGRQPVRRWLESAWLRLGGPQCLVDAGDVRDVAALFDLIERLEAAGRFTPAGLEAAMQELYAAPDSRADGLLQFMTIHKSKGLEFDTVILPGLHRSPRNSDAPLLLWEEVPLQGLEPQLIAAPWVPKHKRNGLPGAYDYLQGLEQQRAANEAARVLYVAATRTERRLHLVGVLGTDSKGEIHPPAGTFLDLLWPSVGGSFMEQAQAAPEAPQGPDESAFVPQLLRLPQPAVPPLLAEASTAPALAAGPLLPAAEAASRLQASCGSLAHAYMEIIAREGAAGWPAERLRQVQPAMRRWLERQGLPREEAEQGAARVAQWLTATLQSADGAWVLRPREGAAAELALSSAQGGGIASHVIDRTFVDNGERWVIDYKSSELGDAPAAAALRQAAERHRAQLERYAGLFREEGLPLRLAVFFLAHGQLVELRD